MSNTYSNETLTIRPAIPADSAGLARLAQRDSSSVPSGRLLVAETGGTIRAALAPDTGRTIADPFFPTLELVELLRTHAARPSQRRPRLRIVASSHPRRRERLAA